MTLPLYDAYNPVLLGDLAQDSDEFLKILTSAFDQMVTMTAIMDTAGRIVFLNRSALDTVGFTIDQVKGLPLVEAPWQKHLPESKKITGGMIAKAVAGDSSQVENVLVDLHGEIIPVLFSISPIKGLDGKIVAIVAEAKEIVELKRLQNRLEKERWETQQWTDSMGAFIAKCDPEGKIISCSQPFLKALKMSMEDVSGQHICNMTKLGHSTEGKNLLQDTISSIKDGKKQSVEVALSFGKSAAEPFLFSINPILDEKGLISFLAVEIVNISEQVGLREMMIAKEKEYSSHLEQEVSEVTKALKETEQFNKNLIDSASMGIIYLDENNSLLFANPEMEQKFEKAGIPRDCIKGKKLAELGIFPAYPSWKKIADPVKQKVTFGQMKMLLNYDEGRRLQFEVHVSPLKSTTEGIRGTVLIMDDVTERNRLDEEMLRTRIRSEKMSSLELLISGVAHELNNPLTSIIGCAEYLNEDASIGEEAREAAKIIVNDANRAGKIVKNLLAFAKKYTSEENTINLNEVLRAVWDIRIHELKNRGIEAVLELDPDIRPIEADATQMQQVILNLASNAVHAIEESGTGDRITVRTIVEGGWLTMELEDNGPGISEKHLPKIFDPFFTTKQPGKGTGLGLSIVYGIIEKHGGSISVDRAYKFGTKFVVRLPLSKSSVVSVIQTAPVPTWLPGRVLVVDDEKNICLTLSKYLADLGCRVDTAKNGCEALDKIKDHAFDLMLVDIKMPELDGLQLYQRLREERPELTKRFAFITGISGQEMEDAINTSELPILQKPFSRKDILRFFLHLETKFAIESAGESII